MLVIDHPAHIPLNSVMTVTLRNSDPSVAGRTNGPGGINRFDETIDTVSGSNQTPNDIDIDVDTETRGLVVQLDTSPVRDSALEAVAMKVYGRLTGETIAARKNSIQS